MTSEGLAILPTWLVVKDHEPVEHRKPSSDEEQGSPDTLSLESPDKSEVVVGETVVTK